MRVMAANSPAEVLLSRLVRKPWNTESPDVRQIIPREKATAKYPNPMGIPSCKPWRKAAASLEALLVYTESIFLVEICIIIHHNDHKKIQKTKKSKYNNLNYDSAVQCEDIRCVSKARMGKYICSIDTTDLDEIKKRLKKALQI